MEKESLQTKSFLSKADVSFNSIFFTFDLPTLIEKMKQSKTWEEKELDAMILLKSPFRSIVLTALHEGTEIVSFQSNDSMTLQIIEGKLKFNARKDSITLNKGQVLTLNENIKYSLTSIEQTVFLLTVSNLIIQPAEN